MGMRPLRVRAYLQDGRVAGGDPWLPLDGILAWAWMRDRHPEELFNSGGRLIFAAPPDLPLARLGEGDDWFWACSFNTRPSLGEYIKHWHKRFDLAYERYLASPPRRIGVGSGRYRSYRMPLPILLFDCLEWFAVGDRDEVLRLCRLVTHVGKKVSQGFGAVDRWEVVPWPHDWSLEREGELTRPLPASLSSEPRGRLVYYGIRPPYWDTDNWRLCWWR